MLTNIVTHYGDVTVVSLIGRMTANEQRASSATVPDLIHDLVRQGHKNILLNLRDVSYMDSSGIGDLFTCLKSTSLSSGIGPSWTVFFRAITPPMCSPSTSSLGRQADGYFVFGDAGQEYIRQLGVLLRKATRS